MAEKEPDKTEFGTYFCAISGGLFGDQTGLSVDSPYAISIDTEANEYAYLSENYGSYARDADIRHWTVDRRWLD